MVVGNEMEIFITLTKYSTHQWSEEVVVNCLVSILPSNNNVKCIYEDWDIPICEGGVLKV